MPASFVRLTMHDGKEISVNVERVAYLYPRSSKTTVVFFDKDLGTEVKGTVQEIETKLDGAIKP